MIDNLTKSAKNELTKVDEQIDNINNKYSKDAIQEPNPREDTFTATTQDSGAVRGRHRGDRNCRRGYDKSDDQRSQEVEVEAEVSEPQMKTPKAADITQEDFVELQTLVKVTQT